MPPFPQQQQVNQQPGPPPQQGPQQAPIGDPLRGILDPIPDNRTKHDAWDAYHKADSPEAFRQYFDAAQLPNSVKHALWNLKFAPPIEDPKQAQKAIDEVSLQRQPMPGLFPGGPSTRPTEQEEQVAVGQMVPQWAVSPMSLQWGGRSFGTTTPLGGLQHGLIEPYERYKQKVTEWGAKQAEEAATGEGYPTIQAIREQAVGHKPTPTEIGVARGIGGAVTGMVADPLNWPFFASGAARPVLQQLISGGFGIQMGAGALQGAQQLYDNWDRMSPQQRSELATQTGLNTVFATLATMHGLSSGPRPEATVQRDVNRQVVPETGGVTPSRPATPTPDIEKLKSLGGLKTQGGGQLGIEGGPGPVTRPGMTAAGQRGTGALSGGQRAETTAITPQQPTVGTVTPKPPETDLELAIRTRGMKPSVSLEDQLAQQKAAELQQAETKRQAWEQQQAARPSEATAAGATQEAINRQQAEKSQGVQIVSTDTRSGKSRPLVGPEAHAGDIKPGPYDRIERVYPDGRRELISEGSRSRPTAAQAPTTKPAAPTSAQPVSASQAASRPAGEPIRPGQAAEPVREPARIAPAQRALQILQSHPDMSVAEASRQAVQESRGRGPAPAPEPAARPLKPLAGRITEPVEARKSPEAIPPAGRPTEAPKTPPIERPAVDKPYPEHPLDKDAQQMFGKSFRRLTIEQQRALLQRKKPGEAGFVSFGGKKPASKKAAQAEELTEAIRKDKLHKIAEKLDLFVKSLPAGTVDQRLADANAAIRTQPTTQPGKIRQGIATITTNLKVFGDWYKNGERNGIKLRDAFKGNTDPKIGFRQALGKYNEAENIGAMDATQVVNDIREAHPKHIIDAMHVGLDVGFDKDVLEKAANNQKLPEDLRKAAHIAQRLTPEERAAAEHYDSFFKETGEMLVKTGSLRHMLETYVPHLVDMKSDAGQKFMAELRAGVFDTNFKYARKRIHETMFEGAEKGVKYRLGIDGAIWDYHRRAVQATGSRAFLKELSDVIQEDQRPALVPGYNSIQPILPAEYSKYPAIKEILDASPKLRAELADAYMFKDNRGAQGPIMDAAFMDQLGIPYDENKLLANDKARMDVSDYKHVEHPSFKQTVYVGKGKDGKPVFYKADLYAHPAIYEDLKNIYEGSQFRTNKLGRAALAVTAASKRMLLKVLPSGFHYTQEGWHAVGHGVNPFKTDIWSGETVRKAVNDPIVRKGLRAGLQLWEYDYSDAMEGIKGVRGFEKDLNNHLFGKFVAGLKIETFKKQVAENLKIYRSKGYSEQRIYEMTAQQINNAYGMQNRLFTGRTKFMQDLFRLTALAPDFLESRARFVGGAMRPGGHRQRVALMRQFLYMYGAARALNALTNDGDAKWDPKDVFTWHFRGHEFSIRSVLTDAMFAATAPSDFLVTRGALFPKAIYEAGKEAGKPTFMKEKVRGGVTEGTIRNTVPIMLQRPTMALFRKFYEAKYGTSVAWEAFAGMLEAVLGIREREEQKPQSRGSGGLPGLPKTTLPRVR
jgi:hypothetical protein